MSDSNISEFLEPPCSPHAHPDLASPATSHLDDVAFELVHTVEEPVDGQNVPDPSSDLAIPLVNDPFSELDMVGAQAGAQTSDGADMCANGYAELPSESADITAEPGNDEITLVDTQTTPGLELDSFVPILEALSGILYQGQTLASKNYYFLRGIASESDIARLDSLLAGVEVFTLTRLSHKNIPLATLLRILQLRSTNGPLFPFVKTLRFSDGDIMTTQLLDMFYSSTLEGFELNANANWFKNDCTQAFEVFISNLSREAPNLSSIKISSGGSTLKLDMSWSGFTYLKELHLSEVSLQSWRLWDDLSQLPSLQVLDIHTTVPSLYDRLFSQRRPVNRWDCIVDSPQRIASGFVKLAVLRVTTVIEALDELLGMISSKALEEVDVTLLTYSAPPPTSQSGKRQRVQFMEQGNHFTPKNEDSYFFFLLNKILDKPHGKLRRLVVSQRQDETNKHNIREHFIPPESLMNILTATTEYLKITGWRLTQTDFTTMGTNVFLQHLRLPIDPFYCTISDFSALTPSPGIPLSALSSIGRAFPNLVSFHGFINRGIYDIPDFTQDALVADDVVPNHSIKSLSLGKGKLQWIGDEDEYFGLRVGLYLHVLFPDLQEITSGADDDSEDWRYIKRAVNMCKAARA